MNINHPGDLVPDVMEMLSRAAAVPSEIDPPTNDRADETSAPNVTRLRAGQSSRRRKRRQDVAGRSDDAGHASDQPEPAIALGAAPERWNHGAEPDVTRTGTQRIRSGVMQLRTAGEICDADVRAAERWYRDYALAVYGAREAGMGTGSGDLGQHDVRAIAMEAYRSACRSVGMQGDVLLRSFVAAGMSMTAIGKQMNRDLRKITGAVVITLQRITEHYGEVDGTRPADDTGLRTIEFR